MSDQLALTLSATSRLVDSLVVKGLVARAVPAGNRRTVSLSLTAVGTKSLDAAIRETRKDLAARLRKLTAKQRAGICRSMQELRGAMEG
jgi:DNA-binding MarR family transcriptional regulator